MGLLANTNTTVSLAADLQDSLTAWERVASLDFWLGAPLRILLILLVASVVRAVLSVVIRKITNSVARGTSVRVVPAKGRNHSSDQQAQPEVQMEPEPSTATIDAAWTTDNTVSNSRQAQRAQTVGSVLRNVASIVVWAVAILMIISELGFNIAPVIASAGIAGVALSFGAQSLVKDYLSGIFIVAEDQLGIGDYVDLGEAQGTVESVGLRTTQVRDANGTLWHVRNGEILRVGNFSQGWSRTNIDLPIPYDSDVEHISAILLKAAKKTLAQPQLKKHVYGEPEVLGVESVTGESLTIRVSVKTAPSEQWGIARVLRVALKKALDDAGARIPLANQSIIRGWSNPKTQSFPIIKESDQQ